MDRNTEFEHEEVFLQNEQFTVTWKRWVVLAIASLLNMSVAMVWLCFSPVAYKTARYYDTDLIVINTLSMIFMITAIPCGLLCLWVLEKYGLRICLLICAWCGCIGSLVRICSTITSLSSSQKLVFLFLGQIIASIGSPFGLYTPPKLAAAWFPDNQRTIANTIAASANPVGIILTGLVSPLFLHSDGSYDMRLMLGVYAIPIMVGAVLATFFITSNGPSRPPSFGGMNATSIKVADGVRKNIRNPMFMILVVCLGGGIGLYASFATLLEQVLCPWGYTDVVAGICASVLTSSGIVGALIIGLIVDKTKRFSECLKAVYCLTAAGVLLLSFTHDIYMGYAIIAEVALIGFFAFAIYPVGTEIAAECTYPVGVAISTGFIQLSGQVQSLIMILVLSYIGSPMTEQQVLDNNSQCHISPDPVASGEEEDTTYDMRVPMYVAAGLCTSLALLLTFVFRAKYRRMDAERQHTTDLYTRRQSALPSGVHLSTKENGNCYENSESASIRSTEKRAPPIDDETNNQETTIL